MSRAPISIHSQSWRSCVALGALLFWTQAHAISGNELAQSCRGAENNERWGFCVGYVLGVIDQGCESKEALCVPAEVVQSQLARVTLKWLSENPDKLHFSASSLVRLALRESFPCRN